MMSRPAQVEIMARQLRKYGEFPLIDVSDAELREICRRVTAHYGFYDRTKFVLVPVNRLFVKGFVRTLGALQLVT